MLDFCHFHLAADGVSVFVRGCRLCRDYLTAGLCVLKITDRERDQTGLRYKPCQGSAHSSAFEHNYECVITCRRGETETWLFFCWTDVDFSGFDWSLGLIMTLKWLFSPFVFFSYSRVCRFGGKTGLILEQVWFKLQKNIASIWIEMKRDLKMP